MRKGLHNKILAGVLALSVVVSGSGVFSLIDGKDSSAASEGEEITKIMEPEDITLRSKWNDKSNIGDQHDVTLSNGTTIKVKDNGSVRADMTAQKLADEEMGLGINLGNTLEAVALVENKPNLKGTDFDTAWSNPPATRELIDSMHSYGINTLRIPIAWSNGDIDDGTYTIRGELLDRVEEVVNYALDNGMYVIINDHWDNQWWGQFGACKRDEDGNKIADQDTRDEAWKRYESYWTQISERFKGYSDHLIFEGANEELGDRLNDGIVITDGPSKGYCKPNNAGPEVEVLSGNLTTAECYETANKINQKFVEIVRGTGDNNEGRFLLIPGYNTDFSATKDARFVMPTDTIAENGKDKLFVSVHYYQPNDFALDNPSGIYTKEDQENHKKYFEDLQRFNDEGYAIIIGECGVVEPSAVSSSVTQCLYDEFTLAQQYHAVPVLWDNGVYFDRDTGKIAYKDIAILYNTINDANGSTDVERETGGAIMEGGGDNAIPDYIDKELWSTPGVHAYLFFQTLTWDYRDAYKPQRNLGKGKHSWEYIRAGSAEVSAQKVKVTDALITENGEYTVALEGADLSGANAFTMLGISTDVDKKVYPLFRMSNASIKIDGVNLKEEPFDLIWKEDDPYYDFCVINVYDEENDPVEDYPLGKETENQTLKMPQESIEITFTVSGLDQVFKDIADGTYVNPETGKPLVEPTPAPTATATATPTPTATADTTLKKGQTVTSKNITYTVTDASKKTVAATKATKKVLKAKKITIPNTVKVNGISCKVTSIGKNIFKGSKATTVTLGKNVKKIEKGAFANCKKLKTLKVQGKLTKVAKGAFKGCKKKIAVKGAKKTKKANVKLLKKSGYKKFK